MLHPPQVIGFSLPAAEGYSPGSPFTEYLLTQTTTATNSCRLLPSGSKLRDENQHAGILLESALRSNNCEGEKGVGLGRGRRYQPTTQGALCHIELSHIGIRPPNLNTTTSISHLDAGISRKRIETLGEVTVFYQEQFLERADSWAPEASSIWIVPHSIQYCLCQFSQMQ